MGEIHRHRAAWLAAAALFAAATAEASVSFNRDIRPLLVKNCLGCHGDVAHSYGNVLLKSFEDATGQTGYEPVIVPGDSAASPLYRRIAAVHADQRMPPPESGKSLSADEIESVRRWIDGGAEFEKHWAYMPLQRPPVPQLEDAGWVRNPIDAFVLEKLQAQGLRPSPVADDRTLLRRLTLDLHGLPPRYEDIVQHQGIGEDDARFDALVEDLLASPHHGERMALPWLDWVKYSDESSDRGDYLTPFFAYRNYVIRAFTDNMRFDRFTVEQLAGDLLEQPTTEQLVASGFNHLIVRVQDGVGKEAIHKYLTERVDKLGQVWLASSLECAQCHDHKFDPWSQKQYYQFAAFFADLDRIGVWTSGVSGTATEPRNAEDSYFKLPRVYLPTVAQSQQLAALDDEIAALRAGLGGSDYARSAAGIRERLRAEARAEPDYFRWVDPAFTTRLAHGPGAATELTVETARPPGGNGAIVTGDIQYLRLDDASAPGRDYRLRFTVEHDQLSALMLRITRQGGDGRSYSHGRPDEVAIAEFGVALVDGDSLQPLRIAVVESTDLGEADESLLIDGDADSYWRVAPADITHKYRYERRDDLLLKTINDEVFVVFHLDEPLRGAAGKTLQVDIRYRDEASRARSINLAYTPNLAASPFQKHAPGPVAASGVGRKLRQTAYDFVQRRVWFTDFWDFTVSQIFTWAATRAGVSAPVPFNDVMKSVLATLKERYAWEEIFREHVVLRAPEMRGTGQTLRRLERQRERLWGEIERSWMSSPSTRAWPVRVLKQGQIDDTTGERVGTGLPAFLDAPQTRAPTRLDLAQWLVDADNPLTARVMVNRLWRLYMGNALVPTLEEFGSGGELPTHPELLSWLAAELIDSGWDLRHVVRLIVSSSTYRQASTLTEELEARDPENRWYARQSRFRIDAEFMQDSMLAVGGLLQAGLYGEHTMHDADPSASDRDRRSIYLLRKNIDVQPELRAFGAKPREKAVIHRAQNITPMQALASLNQPLVMRVSQHLADELLATPVPVESGLQMLYRRVLQRDPEADERALFRQALAQAGGRADRAFWIDQARALLSLRETMLRT
jgi:hypothetical protein